MYSLHHEPLGALDMTFEQYSNIEFSLYHSVPLPEGIDMAKIGDLDDIAYDTIRMALKHEKKSTELEPLVAFTASSFGNAAGFNMLYPMAMNPYEHLMDIFLSKKLLFMAGNADDLKSQYDFRLSSRQDSLRRLGALATSHKMLKSGNNQFSGYVLDNRFSLQPALRKVLEENAAGKANALSKSKLKAKLESTRQASVSDSLFQETLLSLKRQGFVASSKRGYFHIQSIDDMLEGLAHHHGLRFAIKETMKQMVYAAEKRFGKSFAFTSLTDIKVVDKIEDRWLFVEDELVRKQDRILLLERQLADYKASLEQCRKQL